MRQNPASLAGICAVARSKALRKPSTAIFVHGPELDKYPYPLECPFKSHRAGRTRSILAGMGLLKRPECIEEAPSPAEKSDILSFHTSRYLDVLRRASDGQLELEGVQMGLGTPDTPIFHGMYEYASLACGATLLGARRIARREAHVAFNPSGGYHHAGPQKAAGFCYINDVAVACNELARTFRRVLFLDLDAHHGDGVQNAFYHRSDVMTISLHESGRTLFPGTGFEHEVGEGEGRGYCVNVPLPAGTYDEAFLMAFDAVVMPLAGAYEPEVIVLELGLDGLAGDPLAHLTLTNNAYAYAVERIMRLDRPILATGGGGYHPENTARGWALLWTVLSGQDHDGTLQAGLGGVMLESTDWQGGLRDRAQVPDESQRRIVDEQIEQSIKLIRCTVFPIHRL